MKLLELLVQELPKRGGWPSEATKLHQDYDGEVWMHLFDDDIMLVFRLDRAATNARQPVKRLTKENIVTRDQYEAALAASQRGIHGWKGEDLPPVGYECEILFIYDTDPVWWYFKILFMGDQYLLAKVGDDEHSYRITSLTGDDVKFRPFRSEADKKRDAIISAIEQVYKYCPHSDAVPYAVYDAIADGKIPGLKVEE